MLSDEMEIKVKSQKKLNSVRRFIGERMKQSLRDYPQNSGMAIFETDKVFELKDELKKQNKNVTVTSMFVKLLAEALAKYPIANSTLETTDAGDILTIYDSVNIGVGVGTEGGIMVIVLKECQDRSIFDISDELREKMNLLKENKLPLSEMKGSTFTVSSFGSLAGAGGLMFATPVLNPPENCMIGIGTTEKTPVVLDDNSIAVRQKTAFSITVNHTVLDGFHAANFLNTFAETLQDPKAHMGL